MFDLIGAMFSIGSTMGVAAGMPLLLFIAFGFASYFLYHKKLKATA
jgi:hypothetical protein